MQFFILSVYKELYLFFFEAKDKLVEGKWALILEIYFSEG